MTYVICVAAADLRKEPQELIPKDFSHHNLRDSQLLFGEKIRLEEENGDWLRISALEQAHFTKEKGWHPYPGWVHRSEVKPCTEEKKANASICVPWVQLPDYPFPLSYGTHIHLEPNAENARIARPFSRSLSREQLLQDARLFLDTPYLWGGTGFYSPSLHTSVDCSGLIYLLFRAQGKLVPRDAHDQCLLAKPLTPEELKPGDCIFLSKLEKPERVTHVMIYTGNLTFIEAPMTGKKVRQLGLLSPLGDQVHIEDRPGPSLAKYGTFFA